MTVTARDPRALALLFHKLFGHRNYADCADELGIQLPANMPICVICKLAKSKRTALTGGDEALYDAPGPRPVHTFRGTMLAPSECLTGTATRSSA